MLSTIARRRFLPLVLTLAASMAVGACSDSTDPDEEEEPEVAAIVITAVSGTTTSTTTINNLTGAQTGTLTLRANQPNTITVRFLDATNADESVIAGAASEFQVRIRQGTGTTNVFTATGTTHPYTGTITPTATGTTSYTLELNSVEHGHVEVTRTFTATVQ